MTNEKELPAKAAEILRTISSSSTCNATTVESLKTLLLPIPTRSPPEHENKTKLPQKLKGNSTSLSRAPRSKRTKEAAVLPTVLLDTEFLDPPAKLRVATHVLNITLKVLTEEIRKQTLPGNRGSTKQNNAKGPESKSLSSPSLPPRTQTPLQPLSINCIVQSPRKNGLSGQCLAMPSSDSCRAQAECSRIGLACLRSLQLQKDFQAKFAPLQLEKAMSALIGKLVALDFQDLASKELRLLKKRIEIPPSTSKVTKPHMPVRGTKPPSSSDPEPRKEYLPDLLQYQLDYCEPSLYTFVVASQIQVLKILALKCSGAATEAAIEHLKLDKTYSPFSILISLNESEKLEDRKDATRHLEALMGAIQGLVPRSSQSEDQSALSSKYPSPEKAFELQILMTQAKILWWKVANHYSDVQREVIDPLVRSLRAFHRRFKSQGSVIYKIVKCGFDEISKVLENHFEPQEYSLRELNGFITHLAIECQRGDDAATWVQAALADSKKEKSETLQTIILTCQFASIQLNSARGEGLSNSALEATEHAITSLEGGLHGDSGALDELLKAVSNLRKSAFLFLQDNYKEFDPAYIICKESALGGCARLLFSCVRYLLRYIGHEPKQGCAEQKITRYSQRISLAEQTASGMIQSTVFVARLSLKGASDVWEKINAALVDCVELCSVLQSHPNGGPKDIALVNGNESHQVSLSQIYWYRYQSTIELPDSIKERTSCLQRSIEILRQRPVEEQIAGRLAIKLERLAGLLAMRNEFNRAQSLYGEALRLYGEAGVVQAAADQCSKISMTAALTANPDAEHLDRILLLYPEVSAKLQSDDGPVSLPVYDAENLSKHERGLLLLRQFDSIVAKVGQEHSLAVKPDKMRQLISLLLNIYSEETYSLQRVHVLNQVLYLSLVYPSTVDEILISECTRGIALQKTACADLEHKEFQILAANLAASSQIYLALREGKIKVLDFADIFATWCLLIRQQSTWDTLSRSVYSISAWIAQLDLIRSYFAVKANAAQRLVACFFLVSLYQVIPTTKCDNLVLALMELALQYATLGYSGQAGVVLQRAQRYLDCEDLPKKSIVMAHLANAEFALICGDVNRSDQFVLKAHSLAIENREEYVRSKAMISHRAKILLMKSEIACAKGQNRDAVLFARLSAQTYHQLWTRHERKTVTSSMSGSEEGAAEALTQSIADLSLSECKGRTKAPRKYSLSRSHAFWDFTPCLFRATLHLSKLYAHNGLLLEAQYYLDECEKLAASSSSPYLLAPCLALRGRYSILSGDIEQGLRSLREAEHIITDTSADLTQTTIHQSLAHSFFKGGQQDMGLSMSKSALQRTEKLATKDVLLNLTYGGKDQPALAKDRSMINRREGRANRSGAKASTGTKRPTKASTVVACSNAGQRSDSLPLADSIPLQILKEKIIRQIAFGNLSQNLPDVAASLLEDVQSSLFQQQDIVDQAFLWAKVHVCQALKALAEDPILSVITESTISSPAAGGSNAQNNSSSNPRKPPTQATKFHGKRSDETRDVVDKMSSESSSQSLSLAQKCLIEVLDIAKTSSPTNINHMLTAFLSKIVMMLSVLSSSQTGSKSQLLHYFLELGRMLALRKESQSIDAERYMSNERYASDCLLLSSPNCCDAPMPEDCLNLENFRSQYIDIIPASWLTISMTLSESREEIWVSRVCSGQNPLVLKLPFKRESTTDCEGQLFDFDQGKSEMLDIIECANSSAHHSGDLSQKGAKTEWWKTRSALDTRLGDLLTNIEQVWFGGFRGVLSPHKTNLKHLARFQQSFQTTLDKHLPSRQRSSKNQHSKRVNPDPQVLELFVGLGDPSTIDDLDEHLLDLLYFVIDILQINGERNAYDEIDFDAMTVEILDALRHYYQAFPEDDQPSAFGHTILILDKKLHCFPWESLPCMKGRPISRLPSLGCLRRRILQMNTDTGHNASPADYREGIVVDKSKGAYILNPGNDLTNTQAALEEPLACLSGWSSIIQRAPDEAEVKGYLQENQVLLYFGHGSAGQYIRPRTIKKLEKCATTLLMGCSSGTLHETGEYEPYGTPMSYMQAGCPALLATLWDVTDKDIDRYSEQLLRKWGLFSDEAQPDLNSPVKRGSKQKGKKKLTKAADTPNEPEPPTSLDAAAARSRDSCFLRYLNGAAPVVYGIPVYIR